MLWVLYMLSTVNSVAMKVRKILKGSRRAAQATIKSRCVRRCKLFLCLHDRGGRSHHYRTRICPYEHQRSCKPCLDASDTIDGTNSIGNRIWAVNH